MKYIMSVLLSLFLFIGINMTTPAYSIGILSQDGPETIYPAGSDHNPKGIGPENNQKTGKKQ
jgi:hypothetical protein